MSCQTVQVLLHGNERIHGASLLGYGWPVLERFRSGQMRPAQSSADGRLPAGAIIQRAQCSALRHHSPDEVAHAAAVIARQIGRIARIAENLLDTTRIARGELSFMPATVDLNSVTRLVIEQLRPSAKKKTKLDKNLQCERKGERQIQSGSRLHKFLPPTQCHLAAPAPIVKQTNLLFPCKGFFELVGSHHFRILR